MGDAGEVDMAVVGAGPLGIELHVGLKRAGFSVLHLEARQIGATMMWWPHGTRWFSSPERISIAGVPLVTPGGEKATREEYLAYLRAVVEQFGLEIRTYTKVARVERAGEGFVIHARRFVGGRDVGEPLTYRARKVALVTGGTETANTLGIPGEDLPHVSHYFRDPHEYFRQRLVIIGGRNSAVEAALRCHRAGARVALSYRRDALDATSIKYWLYPEFSALIKSRQIEGHFNTLPIRITPTHVRLARAARSDAGGWAVDTAGAVDVPADFVLLLTGYRADMSLFASLGVTLNGEQQVPAYNEQTMETNVPGVYVAGTAIAGTQSRYKVFLENCATTHASRILAHMIAQDGTPRDVPEWFRPPTGPEKPPPALPES